MFCVACGKEIPNEARFCNHCGAAQATGSTQQSTTQPPANPPTAHENNLKDLHTFDWRGVCPSCKLVHTAENCSCPNDASPLVVAFDGHKFVLDRLPVGDATIRCLNDCGFHAHVLACCSCGAAIMGWNISFRFPKWVTRFHYSFHAVNLFLAVLIATPFLESFGVTLGPFSKIAHLTDGTIADKIIFNLFGSLIVLTVCFTIMKSFRPFTRFTFVHVKQAAIRDAKERATQEAIKTAKAVQAATKPLFREKYD